MTNAPNLVPSVKTNTQLLLTRFPNGGWTVQETAGQGFASTDLGAFSNPQDMLEALRLSLIPPEPTPVTPQEPEAPEETNLPLLASHGRPGALGDPNHYDRDGFCDNPARGY